jgi:hypothetical protein
LSFTIGFINTTAYGASSGGISGVNGDNGNPGQVSLVLDLVSQVGKGPGRMLSSLRFSNRDSISDTLQVFKGNTHRVPFRFLNNLFTDNVVDVVCHALLLTAAFLQQSFSCLRTFALQPGSKFGVSFAETIQGVPGVGFAHRIGGDILNPQVNPKKALYINRLWCFLFAGGKKVELTSNPPQIGLSVLMLQKVKLSLTGQKGNSQPALRCPEANGLAVNIPSGQRFPG